MPWYILPPTCVRFRTVIKLIYFRSPVCKFSSIEFTYGVTKKNLALTGAIFNLFTPFIYAFAVLLGTVLLYLRLSFSRNLQGPGNNVSHIISITRTSIYKYDFSNKFYNLYSQKNI